MRHSEWFFGAVMPWALGPHPNFTTDDATPLDLFTLLVSHRYGDYVRQRDGVEFAHEWERLLIEQAAAITAASPAVVPIPESVDVRLPLGPRAAMALVVAYRMSNEDDAEERAVTLLLGVLDATDYEAGELGGTGRVISAAVRLQMAFRILDAGLTDDVGELIDDSLRLLRDARSHEFDDFPTSRGVSWGSSRVHRDAIDLFTASARVLKARTEGLNGTTWKRIVRSRPTWAGSMIGRWREQSATAFVDTTFDDRVRPLSNTVTYHSTHPVITPAQEALVLSEFAADMGGARTDRSRLAKVLVLDEAVDLDRPSATYANIQMALTLLRRAHSFKDAGDLTRIYRRNGPCAPIVSATERIAGLSAFLTDPTRSELAIMTAAADLLTDEARTRAARAAMAYPGSSSPRSSDGGTVAPWYRYDVSMNALSALLPGTGMDTLVAQWLLKAIREHKEHLEYLSSSITSVTSSVAWEDVDAAVLEKWGSWLASLATSSSSLQSVVMRVSDDVFGINHTRDAFPRPEGLELGVRLLIEKWTAGHEPAASELDHVVRDCGERIRHDVVEAGQGRHSFGRLAAADVAAAIAIEFGRDELWEDILGLVVSEAVPRRHKAEALERVATHPEALPTKHRKWLAQHTGELLTAEDRIELSVDISPFPAAVRALGALGLVNDDKVMDLVVDLSTSRAAYGRVEAARSIEVIQRSLPRKGLKPWTEAILIGLARDTDPHVRGEAGFALARHGRSRRAGTAVESLLRDDGALPPIMTLRGWQSRDDDTPVPRVEASVWARLLEHPSRLVRQFATEIRSEKTRGARGEG